MADDQMTNKFTPEIGSVPVKAVKKYLPVIFVIDCSYSMEGKSIGGVNTAMRELKQMLTELQDDNNLEMKVAVLGFTSSAIWEADLTPIEEFNLEKFTLRPGKTCYGAAFHELQKVLTKEKFMNYVGKKAAPAIIFLTDGEPDDDYEDDLKDLLTNGWFVNATRCAILTGDAFGNENAKRAVSEFVDNPASIIAVDQKSELSSIIKYATIHTVAGNPEEKKNDNTSPDPSGTSIPDGEPDPTPGPGDDEPFPDDPTPGPGDDEPFPDDPALGTGDGEPFPDAPTSDPGDVFGPGLDDPNVCTFASPDPSPDVPQTPGTDPFGGNPFDPF